MCLVCKPHENRIYEYHEPHLLIIRVIDQVSYLGGPPLCTYILQPNRSPSERLAGGTS